MDTSRLKRFAAEARVKIKRGVESKLLSLGFDADGQAAEFPRQIQGGTLYRGQQLEESFYDKWIALHEEIQRRGVKEVCEEVAYTWFNRLVAIRILHKNGFIESVLSFDNPSIRVPHIVSEARQGRMPQMSEGERLRLRAALSDPTKTYEQFALLLTAFCHATPIINRCFGAINDYTELLLPADILDEGSVVDMLNQSELISDQDYQTTELIGWLYQFYISERKDEVFASFKGGKKAEAEDIPAATQIFTPNWIVKYMVQNTLGRIYLDNNPGASLQSKMSYLVDKAEGDNSEPYRYSSPEELKVIDPACGSGHILLEAFDLLYDIYLADFYGRDEAIESIFKHNLVGIDLDTRAKQLATFALLLKACQKDDRFLDAHAMPRVLDMPMVDEYTYKECAGHFSTAYGLPHLSEDDNESIIEAFKLMKDASTLGSIMKFDISDSAREHLAKCSSAYEAEPRCEEHFKNLIAGYRTILALTDRYSAVVANPPYMGGGNMNTVLSNYVKKEYPEGKADLATVFVQQFKNITCANGRYAFIIPPSWLFLSTFEDLRKDIIDNQSIDSLLHLSRGVFGADFGAVSCVIRNTQNENAKGNYFRLVERTFQEFDQSHLRILFEQTLANHDFKYRFKDYTKEVTELPHSTDGNRIYYPGICQQNFSKIPGSPIGYWVSERMMELFTKSLINTVAFSDGKNVTGNNDKYLRQIWEVSADNIGKSKKWMLQTKGGEARRWYGNTLNVIAWSDDDIEFYHRNKISRVIKESLWYRKGITWSKICSGKATFRFLREDSTFDEVNITMNDDANLFKVIALLNSKVTNVLLDIVNPTFSVQTENILKLPYPNLEVSGIIAQENIAISRADWDAHETSWDFQENELMATGEKSLARAMEKYKEKWEANFYQLHSNEEELNRQFIEIYGLQDELTPEVPLDEVTILQSGEISIEED